mgnify:FL=1
MPFLAFLAVTLTVGCGGGGAEQVAVVKASGTVQLDGAPHGAGTLVLQPTGVEKGEERPTIGGEIKADGTFTLTTYSPGDGAPPGVYSATIGGAAAAGSVDPADMMGAMSGGTIVPLEVTIPANGSDSLEFKFAGKKAQPSGPAGLLGQP